MCGKHSKNEATWPYSIINVHFFLEVMRLIQNDKWMEMVFVCSLHDVLSGWVIDENSKLIGYTRIRIENLSKKVHLSDGFI